MEDLSLGGLKGLADLDLSLPRPKEEEDGAARRQEPEDSPTTPVTAKERTAVTPTVEADEDIMLEVLENIHIDGAGNSPSKVMWEKFLLYGCVNVRCLKKTISGCKGKELT